MKDIGRILAFMKQKMLCTVQPVQSRTPPDAHVLASRPQQEISMQDMLAMAVLMDQLTQESRRKGPQSPPRTRPSLFGRLFRRAIGRLDEPKE